MKEKGNIFFLAIIKQLLKFKKLSIMKNLLLFSEKKVSVNVQNELFQKLDAKQRDKFTKFVGLLNGTDANTATDAKTAQTIEGEILKQFGKLNDLTFDVLWRKCTVLGTFKNEVDSWKGIKFWGLIESVGLLQKTLENYTQIYKNCSAIENLKTSFLATLEGTEKVTVQRLKAFGVANLPHADVVKKVSIGIKLDDTIFEDKDEVKAIKTEIAEIAAEAVKDISNPTERKEVIKEVTEKAIAEATTNKRAMLIPVTDVAERFELETENFYGLPKAKREKVEKPTFSSVRMMIFEEQEKAKEAARLQAIEDAKNATSTETVQGTENVESNGTALPVMDYDSRYNIVASFISDDCEDVEDLTALVVLAVENKNMTLQDLLGLQTILQTAIMNLEVSISSEATTIPSTTEQ